MEISQELLEQWDLEKKQVQKSIAALQARDGELTNLIYSGKTMLAERVRREAFQAELAAAEAAKAQVEAPVVEKKQDKSK